MGTAHLLRTMWAQNTSLIETANACDVARCGVAMQALPEKVSPPIALTNGVAYPVVYWVWQRTRSAPSPTQVGLAPG